MTGTLRIGNKRAYSDHKPEPGEIIVNIDRPNLLGNPYVTATRSRQEAIQEFRLELACDMEMRMGPRYEAICEIAQCLRDGCDVILMCWCHPLPCHGDVIKETVERLL
jgi:hypothetical protein